MDAAQLSSERLDHLGIVAGICHEIDLVERIDAKVDKETEVLTVGQATLAMILNALGFVGRPLYLSPEYFRNKPVDLLIGEGIDAADLNQHNLGRALDALFEAGITEVFAHVSTHALSHFGIEVKQARLDSSSFSFHGEYDRQDAEAEGTNEPQVIRITHGYSKDKRPDLKQALLNLICVNNSHLPVWLQALSGNEADSTHFPDAVDSYCEQFASEEETPTMIIDSAIYTHDNLPQISDVSSWISKVPARLKVIGEIYGAVESEDMLVYDENTRYFELCGLYGGVKQRWILVEHEPTRQRQQQAFEKKREQEQIKAQKQLKRLANAEYDCEEAAQQAVDQLANSWRFHEAQVTFQTRDRYDKPGRPAANAVPRQVWQLDQAEVVEDTAAIAAQHAKHGRYVLASNELDADTLPTTTVITLYKQQSTSVERGFRFLKDPMFFAHSLFLKKPSRIMALLMVMGLSLLIYALAEQHLRAQMAAHDDTIPDQKGYPTQRPTMRRIFQMFEGIDRLIIHMDGHRRRLILNLTDLHRQILGYFSHHVRKIYGLAV